MEVKKKKKKKKNARHRITFDRPLLPETKFVFFGA